MSKKRLVVIDGKSVFYRGYYAMPSLALSDGTPTGGVYGFAVMALEVLKKYKPDFVVVAWDKSKTNIRRRTKIYPLYKANRKPAPPDFYVQIPILHELLAALGWPLFEIDDHEADDIMATFARQATEKDYETWLITSDHDALQLVNDSTTVAALKKGLTNVEIFDEKHWQEVYGMTSEQYIDLKALKGDTSDNLPGVGGVGEKTAMELITKYGSLNSVYQHIDEIKPALAKKLVADKKLAYITRDLVVLDKHVPLVLDWDKAGIDNLKPKVLYEELVKLEFKSLLNQLPESYKYQIPAGTKQSGAMHTQAIEQVVDKAKLPSIASDKPYFFHIFCKGKHSRDPIFLLVSDGVTDYLLDIKLIGVEALAEWLKSATKLQIVAHDTKSVIKAFNWLGVEQVSVAHDIKVAAFLINALIREQSLTALSQAELGYEGENLDDVHPDDVPALAPKILSVVKSLYKLQQEQFDKVPKVKELALTLEWLVIPVIAKMETLGIKLDKPYLAKMSQILENRISDETQIIYGMANQEFNIASPSQLAEVLYVSLGLPTFGVKKGKTGYSTAARELEKLKGQHPIIEHLSMYRELAKLKSTYVDTLPGLVDDDGRLRTIFSLTTAQTGRLSSSDPNLQNIPVRSDLGREVRQAFVAGSGKTFISADYSQFELRLAAELAGDDELIEAFNDGLDVHTRTAAQVYGCALEDVTKKQRDHAKVINFGILYGMSPHGLSQATGMTQADAKTFIDRYFDLRRPILDYIDKTKEKAKKEGYVETLFGRRRPTPDVHSSNFIVREAALRAAVNMPIQGTEADLMKMAMIEVEKHLGEDAHQLLQIHDSILFEVPLAKAESLAKVIKAVMEGIYKLKVNLMVDVKIADNWGDI